MVTPCAECRSSVRKKQRASSAAPRGAVYAVLAGGPVGAGSDRRVRQNRIRAVLGCRADRPAIPPEELRERFQTLPNRIKKLWAELTVVNEKATAAK